MRPRERRGRVPHDARSGRPQGFRHVAARARSLRCSIATVKTLVIEGDPGWVVRARSMPASPRPSASAPWSLEPRQLPQRARTTASPRRSHASSSQNLPERARRRRPGAIDSRPSARRAAPAGRSGAPSGRRHVQAALRDWMLGLARQHRLMLAVDDLEQVDEPSAALLAMLAHEIKRRSMIIAVTRKPGAGVGLASRRVEPARLDVPARGALRNEDRGAGAECFR